jgi:uncharacterized protein (DUF1015 family)
MAVMRPFNGLRYRTPAGALGPLLAPPHDRMTPARRDEFAAQSPYNAANLTVPEANPDDRSKFIRYARSAARLAEWMREGVLDFDATPSLYRLTQTTAQADHPRERVALVGRVPLEALKSAPRLQVVSPRDRDDRLRLLEATLVQLEIPLCVATDPQGQLARMLRELPIADTVEASTESGPQHRLQSIVDPDAIRALSDAVSEGLLIAEGADLVDAAAAFREARGPSEHERPEDSLMVAVVSSADPGLVLAPAHRIVRRLSMPIELAIVKLAERHPIESHHSSRLSMALAQSQAEGRAAFALAFEGGRGLLVFPQGEGSLDRLPSEVADEVLRDALGLEGPYDYTFDDLEAVRAANQGAAVAVILPVPPVQAVLERAGNVPLASRPGLFYPVLPAGLVYWSLKDKKQGV